MDGYALGVKLGLDDFPGAACRLLEHDHVLCALGAVAAPAQESCSGVSVAFYLLTQGQRSVLRIPFRFNALFMFLPIQDLCVISSPVDDSADADVRGTGREDSKGIDPKHIGAHG